MPAAAYARLTSSMGHTLARGSPRVYKRGKVVHRPRRGAGRMRAKDCRPVAGTEVVRLPAHAAGAPPGVYKRGKVAHGPRGGAGRMRAKDGRPVAGTEFVRLPAHAAGAPP